MSHPPAPFLLSPAAVVALCLAATAARGEDIDLGKVPAVAREAAGKAVSKAKWTSASKETEDGKDFWYDIEGTDAKGRYVCVSVWADGTVDEVSTEVAYKDAPKGVTAALTAAVPGYKATTTYEVRTDGTVVRYDVVGTDAKGRAVAADVSADGTVGEVSTEVPVNDVPKAVTAALSAKMPRFKVTTANEVRVDGKVERYDFEGKRPKDKEDLTVSVSPDGKTVTLPD